MNKTYESLQIKDIWINQQTEMNQAESIQNINVLLTTNY